MPYSVDQIEKHTIVTRLSVSIYKMTDEQLSNLFDLLEQSPGIVANGPELYIKTLPKETSEIFKRQLLIARIFILIKQIDKDTLLEQLGQFAHPDLRWVREYPRLVCYIMVDFATKGRAYRSRIRDISASGVFIEISGGFEKNQQVALCFSLVKSTETLPFKIKGKVKRIYPDGIGVQYEDITKYQRDIIDTLLKKIT